MNNDRTYEKCQKTFWDCHHSDVQDGKKPCDASILEDTTYTDVFVYEIAKITVDYRNDIPFLYPHYTDFIVPELSSLNEIGRLYLLINKHCVILTGIVVDQVMNKHKTKLFSLTWENSNPLPIEFGCYNQDHSNEGNESESEKEQEQT